MKKSTKIILLSFMIASLLFAEYRFIMCNQYIERGNNGTIYCTMFGITDTYYVEGWH
jgi:hypothetical protein